MEGAETPRRASWPDGPVETSRVRGVGRGNRPPPVHVLAGDTVVEALRAQRPPRIRRRPRRACESVGEGVLAPRPLDGSNGREPRWPHAPGLKSRRPPRRADLRKKFFPAGPLGRCPRRRMATAPATARCTGALPDLACESPADATRRLQCRTHDRTSPSASGLRHQKSQDFRRRRRVPGLSVERRTAIAAAMWVRTRSNVGGGLHLYACSHPRRGIAIRSSPSASDYVSPTRKSPRKSRITPRR